MNPLNLPTPAEDLDYAAHVLRQLQARVELGAVDRHTTKDGETVFSAWHTSKDGYVCYLLYTNFLIRARLPKLKVQARALAHAYRLDTYPDFPILIGLIVPACTDKAYREYQRAGFDLPLLVIPVPAAFVPMENEVMP